MRAIGDALWRLLRWLVGQLLPTSVEEMMDAIDEIERVS